MLYCFISGEVCPGGNLKKQEKMKLAELKSQAEAILAIPETDGEFSNHSFACGSGGSPTNKVGVPEVHRGDRPGYDTVRNGRSYAGEVVVLCRDTETKDSNGRRIMITPDGTTFVFRYRAGCAASFDYGVLESPKL